MKHVKLFEQFHNITEGAMKVTPESKVEIDDYTTDNGVEIKSSEIVGIVSSAKTEKEFKDYFFNEYGQDAFAEGEMDVLTKFYLDKETEDAEEEKEEEKDSGKEEEGAEDDPLAGI